MKTIIFILCILIPGPLYAVGDGPNILLQQRALPSHLITNKRFTGYPDLDEQTSREIRRLESKVLDLIVERDGLLAENREMQIAIDSSANVVLDQYVNNYLLIVYFEHFLLENSLQLPPDLRAAKQKQEAEFATLGLNIEKYFDQEQSQLQEED